MRPISYAPAAPLKIRVLLSICEEALEPPRILLCAAPLSDCTLNAEVSV